MIAWNAFILAVLASVVLVAKEILFPDKQVVETTEQQVIETTEHRPLRIVPEVGLTVEPGAEFRYSHGVIKVVDRANSLGFLDREPPSAERAAASCHITVIGDSIVEAREVHIPNKLQVRLEELAARDLPHLDVTTSAFGMTGTGQINQLPYYDEYARRLSPKLVVLVFVYNDFTDNSRTLTTIHKGWGPDRLPFVYAKRREDGTFELLPPDLNPEIEFLLRIRDPAYLNSLPPWGGKRAVERAELLLSLDPRYGAAFGDWRPVADASIEEADELFDQHAPPVFAEARELMAFAMDEFVMRADRDGFMLLILPYEAYMDRRTLRLMASIAEDREIPIVSMQEYMSRHGADLHKVRWPVYLDLHMTPYGHQWAAETLLDFLKRNEAVCDPQA